MGEKWPVNLACDSDSHVNHRVLLHAANLRHGTDGFTFPPKEGPKNPTASAGFEPEASMLTARPPKPLVGQDFLINEVRRSHTTTHCSRQKSSPGRVISSSQEPLPDNTHHSQQRELHVPGGIRAQNLSRRTAANFRLRPSDH
jgi:hypothetical protein